ncbi:multidrug effflux MFS transporter [Acinetobacter nosocomialis]|uniref:multidrug effflux MFS transporter n=2 Tax=Acinetobacter nosocomialis TaxID=106654 RepID=UPI0012508173|nr:multidrug effflux MFS transporter [Acinetobacter nosocomialis]MDB9695215.1 multidrug effflux MFS transporter [Acinetobacter nosocomialis]
MQDIQLQQSTQYSLSWILFLSLLMALGPLSVDMYLPALNHMAKDFSVSVQVVSNTLPAYFLGLAVGQLIYGPISDAVGRKKPLYFGLTLYILASILCAYSQNIYQLIFLRVIQALGGCVGVVIVRAVVRDKLTLQASAQAFTTLMMILAIAPVIAPSIGALILEYYEWHIIFILMALIGIACLLGVYFFFQESLSKSERTKFQIKYSFKSYIDLLKDRTFYLPMSIGGLCGGVMFTFLNSASALMIGEFNLSEKVFSLIFGLNGIGIILFSLLSKFLIKMRSIKFILFWGLLIQLFGILLLGIGYFSISKNLIFISIFLIVSTMGLIGPSSLALAMKNQNKRAGAASALMGSMHFSCGLISGVLLNFIFFNIVLNMFFVMSIFSLIALFLYIYSLNKMYF